MHLSDAHHFRKLVAGACMVIAAGIVSAFFIVSFGFAAVLLAVGLGLIGRMVWLESDEAWDHAPEQEGFRPMLGMR
jgi:hypothetical protein